MALFNVFSDPVLKARQDTLDAQWKSLKALYDGCDQTPDSAFAEFVNDKRAWDEFYDSGSDWSDDSKHATDLYQRKAQEWSARLGSWGCFGTSGSDVLHPGSGAAPTIKDPPPDEPGFLDKVGDVGEGYISFLKGVGYISAAFIIAGVLFAFYLVYKGAEGWGVKVGGS